MLSSIPALISTEAAVLARESSSVSTIRLDPDPAPVPNEIFYLCPRYSR